jgi:superoxide reductase
MGIVRAGYCRMPASAASAAPLTPDGTPRYSGRGAFRRADGERQETMQKLDVYKCSLCGNMVEVLRVGGGTLACCGKPMDLLRANSTDAAGEKHVPVVEATAKGCRVKVGTVAHPMLAEHLIEWIEVVSGDRVCRAFLKPGQAPEAEFCVPAAGAKAREFCNLHGLWKS